MGPESVPMPGEVRFTGGMLRVDVDDQAAGVAVRWDAGVMGTLHLETCRLQPRPEPYLLNVEVVRHRLMRILQKQEDWAMFDLSRAEGNLQERLDKLKADFAIALGLLDEPGEAAKVADQALADAVDISEAIASLHAELLLGRRVQLATMPKNLLGVRGDHSVRNAKYRETLAGKFDFVSLPLPWNQLQPDEDEFATEDADELVEQLHKRRLPIIGGPLIDISDKCLPNWLALYEDDFDTVRDLAFRYVSKIVGRYRGKISAWNVVGGLHLPGTFDGGFEQLVELTRLLVGQVKTLLPSARTLVTVTEPFGLYLASGEGTPPLLYAEMVSQSGVACDAFGLNIDLGSAKGEVRDLFQLSQMLDRYGALGKPLYLTAVGCPGKQVSNGSWRHGFDRDVQAEWLESFYHIALSKPFVDSVTWSDLGDDGAQVAGGGLLDDMLTPKPAFKRLQNLRQNLRSHREAEQPSTVILRGG
ncbi:MAG: endo-1,4-beta-xylanase [Planctomycetota bacterium]